MTVPCQWCGTEMGPPFRHLLECEHVDVVELARVIVENGDFVDAEAVRVAQALLEREDEA